MRTDLIGMTMCSGIGAPEVAAPWIDWRFASEIEAFPRDVLQARLGYRTPEDHNQGEPLLWGDMTEITPELLHSRGIPLPDLIVAGTPCQAFSVAGARKGLEDARGNLTLKFVEILHAIVAARSNGKLAVLWENVPGVLSDSGNAFGCFLGGIVGAMDAVIPSEKPRRGKSNEHWKWHPGGECPELDDDGEPTGEVTIIEPCHRLSWPSEGMVEGPWARAAWSVLDAQWFGVAQRRRRVFVVIDFGDCIDPAAILLEPDRLRGNSPPSREAGKVVAALSANGVGASGPDDNQAQAGHIIDAFRMTAFGEYIADGTASTTKARDFKDATDLVAHTLRGEGFEASEDGTGRGTPLVPVAFVQNSRDEVRLMNGDGQIAGALAAEPGMKQQCYIAHPVAFDCKGTEVQTATDGSHPTLRSMGHSNSHQNAGGHAAICYAIQERAVSENPAAGPDGAGWRGDGAAYTLEARTVTQAIATPWAVRRLTPTECLRLQGFPDGHTAIVRNGKPAADGPQYKAIGNSMAVPVIRWILERVTAELSR